LEDRHAGQFGTGHLAMFDVAGRSHAAGWETLMSIKTHRVGKAIDAGADTCFAA